MEMEKAQLKQIKTVNVEAVRERLTQDKGINSLFLLFLFLCAGSLRFLQVFDLQRSKF